MSSLNDFSVYDDDGRSTLELIEDLADRLKVYKADVDSTISYPKSEVDASLLLKADKLTTYTKTEVDTADALKADMLTTYTKTQVDTADALKADKLTTYTKTEVDTADALKADKLTTYTKTQVDTADALKANIATTYTKTQVDTADALKANIAQSAWTTPSLLNSWVNFGGAYAGVAYRKNTIGEVELRGLVQTGVIGNVIFILPVGFRPTHTKMFGISSNYGMGHLNVDASGNVMPLQGSNVYFALDGVKFSTT